MKLKKCCSNCRYYNEDANVEYGDCKFWNKETQADFVCEEFL